MSDQNTRRESARQALFSGKLDIEEMDDVLALYRDLFEFNEKTSLPARDQKGLTSDQAKMRLTEGFSLIDPGDLLPDPEAMAAMVKDVVRILGRHSEDPDALMEDMANLTAEPARLNDLARTFLTEGEEALRKELLLIKGANPEVLMFVLFNALKGSFLFAAGRCEGIDISAWEKGSCPVCGGEPAVGYMMGEGGKRYLICFRCESHWQFKRLTCPYCDHHSPKESGFLFSEDADYKTLSAGVCNECQAYIKGWRLEGDELGDMHPEVEDLKTPGFDRAVEEEGFSRGAPNIFGVWIGAVTEEENAD
ncbi:MAG: formate dehydrogenase accessory protein FdhE [bacterium]|nr:formate dehydrogenase accessory protein FdhE [bacterium]MDT8366077.1 formate dehydrogenase accessory protein FdhE [bacterium]